MNTATDSLETDSPKTSGGLAVGQSSSDLVGFWGATPVDQPAAITAGLTSLTHTAPSTPDYAIQDLTTTTPYGFVTKDEGNTVLKVLASLQVRVGELEARLEEAGIIAAN
jgi:hypothetical protein